jgi:hypothetical protein
MIQAAVLYIWTLTFYYFRLKNVLNISWDFRRCIEPLLGFSSLLWLSKLPSNHSATVTTLLYVFRYFKVFQVSQIFTYGLSDLLLLAVGSLVVFVLREYILKVHILVSSEHKLCQTRNTCIGEHLGQLKDLEISKHKRFYSLERPWNI